MNRFISMLHEVGHVAAVVGRDTGKVAVRVLPVAAPLAAEIFPAGAVADLLVHALPALKLSIGHPEGEAELNALEMMAFSMIMGVIQTTVKNPAHAASVKDHLLLVADDIYMAYGLPPASRPPAPVFVTDAPHVADPVHGV
jgi:hypothetical protein